MKKITIFSRKSLHTSYSCILYLKQFLEKRTQVVLWSNTPRNDIGEKYLNNSYSFFETWYGKIPLIRVLLEKMQCTFYSVIGDKVIIIQDLDFIIPAYLAKMFNKKLTVIHYNTEIHGLDVKYPKYITRFYKKHSDFPDLIIECLQERADYRKKVFSINNEIYVINNTLPRDDVIFDVKDLDYSILKYNQNLPIIIYAGGCDLTRGLGSIIDTIGKLAQKCNFLFFLDDRSSQFDEVKRKCEPYIEKNICHIYPAIDRKKLFMYMSYCDIGINYYNPEVSINHKYASPTKFFEYMALGLKIVSTRNEGIDRIIEQEYLGKCFDKEEEIADAIEAILTDDMIKSKNEIKKIFREKYCYEVSSKKVIEEIIRFSS